MYALLEPNAPLAPASAVVAVAPLRLVVPRRTEDLVLRVTAPANGDHLPVIIFSHGSAQSIYAYSPLIDWWASQGFIVVQPAHADSWMLATTSDDPDTAQFWRRREADLVDVVDRLSHIETLTPLIQGRMDQGRIAVAGHSWGAQTASMLLGSTHPDPADGSLVSIADDRVKAGVLLCVPGHGGDDLSTIGREHFPFMHPDFSQMTGPTLVVAGDADQSPLSVRGPDWWRDAYDQSPGAKGLLTIYGAEHSLGGIHTYESEQAPDHSRARVAAVQRVSTAFLRSALSDDPSAWQHLVAAAETELKTVASLETRGSVGTGASG